MDIYTVAAIKIFASTIAGALIGFERERSGKQAGIKTHSLVSLGSTVITIIGIMTFKENMIGDPLRLPAQIVSGIGFLCAGVIITRNNEIVGLTTAAGLWLSACIGICIGSDYYLLAIPALIAYFFIIEVLQLIDKRIKKNNLKNKKNG